VRFPRVTRLVSLEATYLEAEDRKVLVKFSKFYDSGAKVTVSMGTQRIGDRIQVTSTAWRPLIFEDNFVSIAEEVANGCADALVCRVGELAEIV
jgi:hypothetical protein